MLGSVSTLLLASVALVSATQIRPRNAISRSYSFSNTSSSTDTSTTSHSSTTSSVVGVTGAGTGDVLAVSSITSSVAGVSGVGTGDVQAVSTTSPPFDSESCTPISDGMTITEFSFIPNTTTVYITTSDNYTINSDTTEADFTTPIYCSANSITTPFAPLEFTAPASSKQTVFTATAVITSKSAPTVYTSASPVTYPGVKTDKVPVAPGDAEGTAKGTFAVVTPSESSPTAQAQTIGGSGRGNEAVGLSEASPTTALISNVPVVLSPSKVVINGNTVSPAPRSSTVVSANGQAFTVGPSQVIAPGTTLNIPASGGGGIVATPAPTTVDGVGISFQGGSSAVVDGKTYAVGAGAPVTTLTAANGQVLSMGPGGVAASGTTVIPPAEPTNYLVLGAQPISESGGSVALIGDKTFTFGPNILTQVDVFNGVTLTIGPSGVVLHSTTLGGSGMQIALAGGLSVTEVGATKAIIGGTTLTIGPGAAESTFTIGSETITAGSAGLVLDGTTLSYPFNPTTETKMMTEQGVTYQEIGSSLVVFGGSTFTYGNGAKAITDVYGGKTISIGPGGIDFISSTTRPSTAATGTAASATETGKKNDAGSRRPMYGLMGLGMAIGVWIMI